MTILALIGAGALLIAAGLLFLPLIYVFFGDEMPAWCGDWGPLIGYTTSLVGTLLIFSAILYGVAS